MLLKKEKIYDPYLKSSEHNFYNFALLQALQLNADSISHAKIRIDRFGNKESKRILANYLRKNLNSNDKKVVSDLRFCDSKKEVLIQLSDMVVGSIRKYYEKNSRDYDEYRKILRGKEENIKSSFNF